MNFTNKYTIYYFISLAAHAKNLKKLFYLLFVRLAHALHRAHHLLVLLHLVIHLGQHTIAFLVAQLNSCLWRLKQNKCFLPQKEKKIFCCIYIFDKKKKHINLEFFCYLQINLQIDGLSDFVVGGDLLGGRLVSARLLVQAAHLLLEHVLLRRQLGHLPAALLQRLLQRLLLRAVLRAQCLQLPSQALRRLGLALRSLRRLAHQTLQTRLHHRPLLLHIGIYEFTNFLS
jgi:hypothetical protein